MTKMDETAQTTVKPEKAATIDKQNKSNLRIYVGPSFKGVTKGTVFKNGLIPELQNAIAKMPAIGELVIPVNDIVKANKELANPESALSRFYESAKSYGKGE